MLQYYASASPKGPEGPEEDKENSEFYYYLQKNSLLKNDHNFKIILDNALSSTRIINLYSIYRMLVKFDVCFVFFKVFVNCYLEQTSKIENNSLKTNSFDIKEAIEPVKLEISVKEYFMAFPANKLWKFFCDIDKQKVENGYKGFELREPGYLKAMAEGWNEAFNDLDSPVSIDLIKQIYGKTSQSGGDKEGLEIQKKDDFRDKICSFNFTSDTVSPTGLIESWFVLQKVGKALANIHGTIMVTDNFSDTRDIFKRLVEKSCFEYEEAMKQINKDNIKAKLVTICKFIKELELIHPFEDANCRTFCIILLNRELVKHGLYPAMLNNPNKFDGLCISELVCEIIRGMHNARFEAENSKAIEPEKDVLANQVYARATAFLATGKSK